MTSRVALVTGGTGGIGSAICERLARMGHRVATNYRDEGRARAWQAAMTATASSTRCTRPCWRGLSHVVSQWA